MAYQAFNGILNLLGRGGDQGPSKTISNAPYIPPTQPIYAGGGPSVLLGAGGDQGAGAHIQVNIDASNMIDSANMTRVVQEAFLQINKNGYSTVPAGQGF
jgi:hypothetical protein